MAYENPQFERLKQTIETKKQEDTSRFGSAMADLLQKNNKITEQAFILDKTSVSQMSQYFQTTIKLQTESNNILRQIAEILTKSSSTKNNQSLIGSAAKQGINFDISRERPKKGFISNMWQATANANIQKEVRKSNRKLAKSLGLSMTLTTAMTTPASSKFRGIVAESEMDFNVVNTNILLGMYELQRLSLQQLVDINKQTGTGPGKGSSSISITQQQTRAEKLQTDDFKEDFNQNADPRKMMQKIGGVPLIGGYLQMLTAPIKELLTLPSLPLRLKKGWQEFKDKNALSGKEPTAALKRTGLYKSDQDRAYSFLGGDFIKIIENIRADAAAIRYQVTGEKPGTDPKTGKRLDQSRAELYDTIKGEFFSAKRDKTGKIVQTAEETRLETEKKRRQIIEEDMKQNMSFTSEIMHGIIGGKALKGVREALGIKTIKEQATESLQATRTGELAKAEHEELKYRIEMNEKLPEAIKQMDDFSSMLGILGTTIGGVALASTGLPVGMSLVGGVAAGAVALYKSAKGIREQAFIDEFIKEEAKNRETPSRRAEKQQLFNEAEHDKNLLAVIKDGSLFPKDIKEKIYQFASDIHIIAEAIRSVAGYIEQLKTNHLPIDIQSIIVDKQVKPILVAFDKKDQKEIPHFDAGGNIPAGKTGLVSEKNKHEYVKGQGFQGLSRFPSIVSGPASVIGSKDTENALDATAVATTGLLKYFKDKDKQDRDISVSEQIEKEKSQIFQTKRDKIQIAISDVLKQIQKDQESQTDFLKDTEKKKAKPEKKGFFESIFGGLSFLKGLGTMLLPLIPTILGSIFSTGMGGIVAPIMAGVVSFLTKHLAGGALGLAAGAVGKGVGIAGTAVGTAVGKGVGAVSKGAAAAAGIGAKGFGAVAGKVAGPLAILMGAIEIISDFKETGNVGEAIFGNIKKGGLKDALKGMSKYAAMGAIAGIPFGGPPGMAVGALIGSAIGGIIGWFGTDKINAVLGDTGGFITKMNSSISGFFANVSTRAGSWSKEFEDSKIPIVMPLIGGIFGSTVDAIGSIWSKIKDAASGVPDLIHYANYKISDFFTGSVSGSLAKYGAEHGVPIMAPLVGGLVGGIVDLFAGIFKPASAEFQKVEGVTNLADQSIVQIFEKVGEHSREWAINGTQLLPIPIVGSLIGGLLGSTIDFISLLFGEKVVQDLGDTEGLNSGVVNIFKALGSGDSFGTQWAESGKKGVPILGPLVGGLAGSIVDILAWFIPDSWKSDISEFGDRTKAAWDSMMIEFQEMYNKLIDKVQGAISKTNEWLSEKRKGIANWAAKKADQPGSSKIWTWVKDTATTADERGNATAAEATNWLEGKKAEVETEKKDLAERDIAYNERQKKRESEKAEIYAKFDKKEASPVGVPENAVKKDVATLVKSASIAVKDVSTGLVKTSLKVADEISNNSDEFKDQTLSGVNWLGNSIFAAFKTMGAMFLGIVQKLSGWFKDNAPDYYEKNIKPVLATAGDALKTGGEAAIDFTKNTALPALGTAAGTVKDFAVNTAIPAIKSGAQAVGSSVATGAGMVADAVGGGSRDARVNKAAFEKALMQAGFNTPQALSAAMGIATGETHFTNMVENKRYTTPERIQKIFKKSAEEAQRISQLSAKEQYDIFYGNKLGNRGEGWKYRGRGPVQVTGRDNYAEIDKRLGLNGKLVQNPDILNNDPDLMARVSAEYLKWRLGGKSLDMESGLTAVAGSHASWDEKRAAANQYLASYQQQGVPSATSLDAGSTEATSSGGLLDTVYSGIKSATHHIATGARIVGSSVATGAGIVGNKVLSAAQSMKGMGERMQPEKMVAFLNKYSGTTFSSISGEGNAWCARYVSATLESQGIKSTKSASARSYLNYGQSIWDKTKGKEGLTNVRPGDIAVFGRGNDPRKGHVAFVESVDPSTGQIRVIGGNQSDHVTETTRSIKDLLAIRRPDGVGESADSANYTPMTQSSDQGTGETTTGDMATGTTTAGTTSEGGTNIIQSALGQIGKLAKMAKGGAGDVYDSLNLGQFGFKRPESTTTTYTPDAENQSSQTPAEGNQDGIIRNALNKVADLARKADAVGNANRAKQGRAPVQSLVTALGLDKFGFEKQPTSGTVAGVSDPLQTQIKDLQNKGMINTFMPIGTGNTGSTPSPSGVPSGPSGVSSSPSDVSSSPSGVTSSPSGVTSGPPAITTPKATQEQRDLVAQIDKEYADQMKELGITGITPQQMRLLTMRSNTSKGKDAENLPGYNKAMDDYLAASAKKRGEDYNSLTDEEKTRRRANMNGALAGIQPKKGMTPEQVAAREAKYDEARKAMDAEEKAKTQSASKDLRQQTDAYNQYAKTSVPGLVKDEPKSASTQLKQQTDAYNQYAKTSVPGTYVQTKDDKAVVPSKDPGLFNTIGQVTGLWGNDKTINQPTIKQPTFERQEKKEVWDEHIPTPQSETTLGNHSNPTPITVAPTQRGPSSRQSSNVEHRTTVEEINPSRMDPEVDELVWKLFTTVPDIFKKDANLFGTGIMF